MARLTLFLFAASLLLPTSGCIVDDDGSMDDDDSGADDDDSAAADDDDSGASDDDDSAGDDDDSGEVLVGLRFITNPTGQALQPSAVWVDLNSSGWSSLPVLPPGEAHVVEPPSPTSPVRLAVDCPNTGAANNFRKVRVRHTTQEATPVVKMGCPVPDLDASAAITGDVTGPTGVSLSGSTAGGSMFGAAGGTFNGTAVKTPTDILAVALNDSFEPMGIVLFEGIQTGDTLAIGDLPVPSTVNFADLDETVFGGSYDSVVDALSFEDGVSTFLPLDDDGGSFFPPPSRTADRLQAVLTLGWEDAGRTFRARAPLPPVDGQTVPVPTLASTTGAPVIEADDVVVDVTHTSGAEPELVVFEVGAQWDASGVDVSLDVGVVAASLDGSGAIRLDASSNLPPGVPGFGGQDALTVARAVVARCYGTSDADILAGIHEDLYLFATTEGQVPRGELRGDLTGASAIARCLRAAQEAEPKQ